MAALRYRPFGGLRTFILTATLLSAALPGALRAQARGHDDAASIPAFRDLRWRNIGPANMVGRVTDIEAVVSNPAIVYVASASGGLFKSVNAGTTFEQVFATYGTANMGDVEIFQANPDIVWVGTGESCTRNSIGWGDGVYKSVDGGRTFANVGLAETHHISKVVAHPTDPDIAYVAAQGHLWGYNAERGVYKTTDGGRTWRKLAGGLPADGRTGASDLVMDPINPNVLYAGMWERIRKPHTFESGGPNGGIYKSVDGGESWTKLTTGLPAGDIGKVGLALYRQDPRILVAMVEHGYQPAPRTPEYADMTRPGTGLYRSEDGGASWQFINRNNNRPFYYSHIYIDPNDAQRVYMLATQGQVSEDGGRTFTRSIQGIDLDFHALWIDPANSDRFYIGNDKGAHVTYDRGAHFIMFDNIDASQFYAVTADNRDPYWVYGGLQDNGNWGGPSNSRDYNGVLNDHWFKFHSGDGFHATVDPDDWRTVYTESQGGNIRRLDAVFRQQGKSITPTATTVTNYAAYAGPPAAAPAAGRQGFGGARLPREQFRFNWSTPIVLSPHDSRTIYYAGNHVFRSTDRGDTWTIISPDLTTNDPVLTNPQSGGLTPDITGAETHATAISIMESSVMRGVLWVGTDDGNVQLTRDGGRTWSNVRPNIRGVPERTWVSRVEPSHFDAGTAYVSFDGHRSDDFRPHVYRTTDYGRTWTSISSNLPAHEPVYVVKEDLKNRNLLFVGTEFSVYASLDAGRSWQRLMNDMPNVPVHDLIIHPRAGDLIAATHGRGIWILDDITPLQQLSDAATTAAVHLFENRVATKWRATSRGATRGHFFFAGRNPLSIAQRPPANSPAELQNSATVSFWLKQAPAQPVQIEIASADGSQKFTGTIPAAVGLNRYFWNLRFGGGEAVAERPAGVMGQEAEALLAQLRARATGAEAPAGTYTVKLVVDGRSYQTELTVRDDPAFLARQ